MDNETIIKEVLKAYGGLVDLQQELIALLIKHVEETRKPIYLTTSSKNDVGF